MLVEAGCGVATANASAALKDAADVVLEYTNDEDAVARYVEDALLRAKPRL